MQTLAPDLTAPRTEPGPAVREWLAALGESLTDGSFVKLTLSKGRSRDLPQAAGRLCTVAGAPHLNLVLRHRDAAHRTENHPLDQATAAVEAHLSRSFENAHLFTTRADVELRTNRRGEPRLLRLKATYPSSEAAPATPHNRARRYLLDPATSPWLRALGLVTAEGVVRAEQSGKYRQLQSIIKIVDDLVSKSDLGQRPRLRLVDMGCGKGYLTFALHDYFRTHVGVPCEAVGVDQNAELMARCNHIAAAEGLAAEGLSFETGDVDTFDARSRSVDVLVALHACDTATDTAIHKGMLAHASLIVAVPCCQKELRPQFVAPPEVRALFKHDTFKDRFAQTLTDGLRGLLMEAEGYRTRVFEFISDAHTHRNVMIVGVRDGQPGHRPPRAERLAEVAALKARYGIREQRLERLIAGRS